MPASLIVYIFRIDDDCKVYDIILALVVFQLVFWILSFLFPPLKLLFYEIIGASKSPNLNSNNISVRGFGLSSEINYMSPFLLAFLALYYLKGSILKGITLITQLINSNMVVVSVVITFFISRANLVVKSLTLFLSVISIAYLGELFFPRLYAEFVTGGGTRTIRTLLESHLIITNSSLYEHIFGSARYIFHGADLVRSDIGWVIIYNVGGSVLLLVFSLFTFNLLYRAFGSSLLFVLFSLFFLVLNTKGLVLGVNGFMFLIHFYLFFNCYRKKNSVCQ
ncbi:hypothetical protein BS021_RS00970 [Vibrio parahaemolyticus]|nr:hypothetical protein [Vibrio parahaemolyticus]